jgi:hypothetical protein
MAGEFELAGWSYRRVAPIGERWIEEYRRVVARDLLGTSPSNHYGLESAKPDLQSVFKKPGA